MFTKAEIEAMPGDVVDEYVAEQVMGWLRAYSAVVEVSADGGGEVGVKPPTPPPDFFAGAWVEQAGTRTVQRRDSTTLSAPRYLIRPVATQTPNFLNRDRSTDVLGRMAVQGFEVQFARPSAGVWEASFSPLPTPAHSALTTISAASGPDAIRRAALLAVQ